MKAIVVTSPGEVSLVCDRPKPSLRDDYLLVKTRAVAVNPTDWKHARITKTAGILLGCDYAGVVEEVGRSVTKSFKKGDRVMGFVHGGNSAQPEDGAFAEYIVAKGDIQAHIPDSMSFEDACTFGVGVTAVGQGLYQTLGLPMPSPWPSASAASGTSSTGPHVLIQGGSTASGVLGIQFARLSGYVPIATCSPDNFALAREYGAEQVFDYGDEDAADEIRDATDGRLRLCWDAVCMSWSASFCVQAMGPQGGTLATLQPRVVPGRAVRCVDTTAYTIFGEDWAMGDARVAAVPADLEFGKKWWALSEQLIAQGRLRPHKVRVGAGGLQGVIQGMQMLRDFKVRGCKLVYRIAETP